MSRIAANERFSSAAALLGIEPEIVRFPEDTRTATQAATALNCELGQIIKSLIFECDGLPVLALTAGDRQVDTEALGRLCGGSSPAAPLRHAHRARTIYRPTDIKGKIATRKGLFCEKAIYRSTW